MSNATDNRIRDLTRQLKAERAAHNRTRLELQQELDRVWRLVPRHYISLMGVYPSLRQLFHVIAEAAELQDPTNGAPTEDTARTQFVHVGEHASTSQTERAVTTHRQAREVVRRIDLHLNHFVHTFSQWIGAVVYEYNPPDGECLTCGGPLIQAGNGRPRLYCSDRCRRQNPTKQQTAESATGS